MERLGHICDVVHESTDDTSRDPLPISGDRNSFPTYASPLTFWIGSMNNNALPVIMRWEIIGILSISLLLLTGCDTSESDSLLNPPTPDSTQTRVLNMLGEDGLNVSLGGVKVAAELADRSFSNLTSVSFNTTVPLVLSSPSYADTIQNVSVSTTFGDDLLTTWIGAPSGDSVTAFQLVSRESEVEGLVNSSSSRLYFYNGSGVESLSILEGCSNGSALFSGARSNSLINRTAEIFSGTTTLFAKDDGNDAVVQSGQIELQAGDILCIVAVDDGLGGVTLQSFSLRPNSPGELTEIAPEVRTTTDLRIINGIDGETIDVHLQGSDETIVTGLAPLGVSDNLSITACQGQSGDTLLVVESTGDTSNVPFTGEIGGAQTMVLYRDNLQLGSIVLSEVEPGGEGEVSLRAANLFSTDTLFSIIAGAGAPGDRSRGSLLFPRLAGRSLSNPIEISAGLYPLALEFASSGEFISGGLQELRAGSYTILILRTEDAPRLLLLNESVDPVTVRPLQLSAVKSVLYSANNGDAVTISFETSLGTMTIPEIAYSYVYPTFLPIESVRISGPFAPENVQVEEDGVLVGWTGTGDEGRLATSARSRANPVSGETTLRVHHAAPSQGPVDFRQESTEGTILASVNYLELSESAPLDARRFSFIVTPADRNDELARITGVQLSDRRNYLMVVAPAGENSTTGRDLSIILIQE